MSIIVSNYYSGDVMGVFLHAYSEGLMLYVEYLRKSDNVLRIMVVVPMTVYETYAIIKDAESMRIKRLNFDRVYRMGLEVRE